MSEIEDLEKAAAKAKTDAVNKARELGLADAIASIATEGRFSVAGEYNSSVSWEGCTVQAQRSVSSDKTRFIYEVNKGGQLVLYLETQDGLITFHDGPWVNRLLAEAERQREAHRARKLEGRSSEALRTLERFSEVDF